MATDNETVILSAEQTLSTLDQLAMRLAKTITRPEKRVVVGIRRGGAVVAQLLCDRLNRLLDRELPLGFLDISFYRDDLNTVGPNPVVAPTDLAMDIDDKRIVLVDDVLFTGRTIRAGLNALFDYGRPELVDLLVLVDRGCRQLPIQPDFAGLIMKASRDEKVKLVQSPEGWKVVLKHIKPAS
ncbi:MAG: bifunctional pyr operon transcriptional regulator/uracil phosphoribosyltransferase PyrR [Magnetococcales bacterium]|nr:bifunctional pyr operon transcriptional regulator/uracil phosphoribosyltransferase PyrR [Magnetococcales bacterium]MBF0420540.1 bifunctional pyr operon transcriptional regulator/uracil phosphoribosyltransferase PyrR [Magnetococcales bacterium]MBF0436718.1 bifunctional pyr operon transcriptional regulator/uracil phosphoribosyltransferase PyrR [Magnetococcales bacterium]